MRRSLSLLAVLVSALSAARATIIGYGFGEKYNDTMWWSLMGLDSAGGVQIFEEQAERWQNRNLAVTDNFVWVMQGRSVFRYSRVYPYSKESVMESPTSEQLWGFTTFGESVLFMSTETTLVRVDLAASPPQVTHRVPASSCPGGYAMEMVALGSTTISLLTFKGTSKNNWYVVDFASNSTSAIPKPPGCQYGVDNIVVARDGTAVAACGWEDLMKYEHHGLVFVARSWADLVAGRYTTTTKHKWLFWSVSPDPATKTLWVIGTTTDKEPALYSWPNYQDLFSKKQALASMKFIHL